MRREASVRPCEGRSQVQAGVITASTVQSHELK